MPRLRTTSTVVGLLVVASIALVGCATSEGAPTEEPPGANATEPSPHPTTDTAAPSAEEPPFEVCGIATHRTFNSQDEVVGGYEGWWNSEPADRDPSSWSSEMRQHPAVALVNTTDGTLLEAYDRTGCMNLDNLEVVPDETWPSDSIAIVDLNTLETVTTFDQVDGDAMS